MLVLTRKPMQQVHIGDNITLTIVKVDRNSVRISIEAPRDVRILRGELPRFDTAGDAQESLPESTGPALLEDSRKETPNDRRSQGARRAIPRVDRQDASVPRAPSHPLRWTMASMRQRASSTQAIDSTIDANGNR